MKKIMYISVEADACLTEEFTKNCKSNGYTPSKVIKYLIENPDLLEELCEQIRLASRTKLNEAKELQNSLVDSSNIKGTAYTLRNVDTEKTFGRLLKEYNLTVVFFFSYLYLNSSLVDSICNKLPEELKMLKCRK